MRFASSIPTLPAHHEGNSASSSHLLRIPYRTINFTYQPLLFFRVSTFSLSLLSLTQLAFHPISASSPILALRLSFALIPASPSVRNPRTTSRPPLRDHSRRPDRSRPSHQHLPPHLLPPLPSIQFLPCPPTRRKDIRIRRHRNPMHLYKCREGGRSVR